MKTIEDKAKAYAEEHRAVAIGVDMAFDISKQVESAYLAGAQAALAGQWRRVEDELPEDEEYVLIDGPRGVEPAFWNEHYQVWDDSEGDDFMYKKDAVKMWMSIPQPPVYARTPKTYSE